MFPWKWVRVRVRVRRLVVLAACCVLSGAFVAGCALLAPEEEASLPAQYGSASALYDKAMVYYQRGQYARARDLFHTYVGQYPDSLVLRVALYYLGHCYQMTGDTKEALALYNRIVTSYGDQDFWGAQAMLRIKQIKDQP